MRVKLEAKWVAMSDEDFTVYLEEELGIVTASDDRGESYLERSKRDILPASMQGDAGQSFGERARRHIKE